MTVLPAVDARDSLAAAPGGLRTGLPGPGQGQVSLQALAKLAHDMRTPLYGILGTVELLGLGGRDDPELQAGLARVRQCGEYQLRLIQDVLDLASIDAGRPAARLHLQPCDLPALVAGVVAMFAAEARAHRVGLEAHIDAAAPRCAELDATKLQRVLGNLVSNAVRHARGGTVRLIVGLATAPVDGRADLLFSVIDSGEGLSAAQIDALLDPSCDLLPDLPPEQRPPPATDRHGIGLLATRELLQLMGSHLQIDSAPGRGTCMRFRLMTFASSHPDQDVT